MNYVLSFAKPVNSQTTNVLLVEKDRPKWQRGRYNLPGGKIELNESPVEAAERELEEEAGMKSCTESCLMGAILGAWGTVYCVRISVFDDKIRQRPEETERAFWTSWHDVQDSPLLIPNLRIIIPLLMVGTTDWLIQDEGPSWGNQLHTIKVTVNSDFRS